MSVQMSRTKVNLKIGGRMWTRPRILEGLALPQVITEALIDGEPKRRKIVELNVQNVNVLQIFYKPTEIH